MCSNMRLVASSAHVLSLDPVIVVTTRLQPHDQANDKLKGSHNGRHHETLHPEEAVQESRGAATDSEEQYSCRHLHKPRVRLAVRPLRRIDPVGQIDHDLRGCAGHYRGGGRASEV